MSEKRPTLVGESPTEEDLEKIGEFFKVVSGTPLPSSQPKNPFQDPYSEIERLSDEILKLESDLSESIRLGMACLQEVKDKEGVIKKLKICATHLNNRLNDHKKKYDSEHSKSMNYQKKYEREKEGKEKLQQDLRKIELEKLKVEFQYQKMQMDVDEKVRETKDKINRKEEERRRTMKRKHDQEILDLKSTHAKEYQLLERTIEKRKEKVEGDFHQTRRKMKNQYEEEFNRYSEMITEGEIEIRKLEEKLSLEKIMNENLSSKIEEQKKNFENLVSSKNNELVNKQDEIEVLRERIGYFHKEEEEEKNEKLIKKEEDLQHVGCFYRMCNLFFSISTSCFWCCSIRRKEKLK